MLANIKCACVRLSAEVWVKDEGKGDRTGLSDAAEIRETHDRLQRLAEFLEAHTDV